jgi:pimeloyl-ACP methyl ester carboxylesterase
MSSPSPHSRVTSRTLKTNLGHTRLLSAGDPAGPPVVFVHGNVSSADFFTDTLNAFSPRFHAMAFDLRGFGDAAALPVDATRGVRDFSDDLRAVLTHAEVGATGKKVHLVGWSLGAGVIMQYAVDHPEEVASLTLLAPMSPVGFGGTRDAAGAPCAADFVGSGSGTVNAEFKRRLAEKDASEESDVSPRKIMNQFYFKPPFRLGQSREDALVAEMLKMTVSDDNYPGDIATSTSWPGVAPGARGVNNAISPRYLDLRGFARINPRPDVLWIRGADDAIVSDTSLFDLGFLGQIGAVPGWPGAEAYPAQPMIAQTRALLDAYREAGGKAREEVIPNVGHAPHLEAAETVLGLIHAFVAER